MPCGVVVVEGKKGNCEIWVFRSCLEEGLIKRLPIGKIESKEIKIHWLLSDEEGHQIAIIGE